MPERKWLAGAEITIREFLVIRHIRAAYTSGAQGYLNFAQCGLIQGPAFLYVFSQRLCRWKKVRGSAVSPQAPFPGLGSLRDLV